MGLQNCHSAITAPIDSFSYSFILAVSENQFVEIMANSGSNNSSIFLHFLNILWRTMKNDFETSNDSFWIVMNEWMIEAKLKIWLPWKSLPHAL